MKFSGFRWAFSLCAAVLLAACSETTSSTDDYIDDSSSSAATVKKSSSSGAESSSSQKGSDFPEAEPGEYDSSMNAPTGLSATEIGGNWVLDWSYEESEGSPAAAFVVQVLDLEVEGVPAWKNLAQTMSDVYRYRIGKLSSTYLYYRVAALNADGARSAFSDDVLIEVSAEEVVESSSSADALVSAPTGLSASEIDGNWILSWSYENDAANPASKFVVRVLDLNADSAAWKDLASVDLELTRYRVGSLSSTYLYYCVAAENADGLRSECSDDVLIEVSAEEVVESSSSADAPVSAPTGLSASLIGGSWVLSWSHSDNAGNPAAKFVIQKLNLESANPSWSDLANVTPDLTVFSLGKLPYAYFYFRVAAENAAGERSEYSNVYLVNVSQTSVSAPVISGASVSTDSTSRVLNWSFAESSVFAATKFQVEKLDLETNEWVLQGVVDASTNRFQIGLSIEDRYFRVLAVNETDTLASATYTVPAEMLAVPTNISATRIAPSVWELTWDYSRNSLRKESGFLVQGSADGSASWSEVSTVSPGILYYHASGNGNLEKFFRVAAYDNEDTTAFTAALQIVSNTADIPYRGDLKLTTPSVTVSPITQTTGDVTDTIDYALSIESDFTNKNILNSEYTEEVSYEVRWYTEDDGSTVSETIENTRLATKYTNISGHLPVNGNGNVNLYGQLRIVWKDVNGVTDYSEWTAPQTAGKVQK